jgi:hypothetical protein
MRPRIAPRSPALATGRPSILLVAAALLALMLAAAWLVTARSNDARATSRLDAGGVREVAISTDVATQTWSLEAPLVAADPVSSPVPVVDWSALSVGVAAARAPETRMATAAAPAELAVAMSAGERRALIAAAHDDGSLPSPEGYRPGIVVIVPAGSGSDGICR